MRKIRILIVDDAVVVRRQVTEILSDDPSLEVVGAAATGHIALAKIPQVNPDVVILDVLMPEMDGLETLAAIQKRYPHLCVIMFSAFTERGAAVTLDALSLGARDYVAKPTRTSSIQAVREYIQQELIPKIKVFCADISGLEQEALVITPRSLPRSTVDNTRIRAYGNTPVQIVAIGVSTGGPDALTKILPQFPANFPVPIVIVQHMPAMFTQRLADRLTAKCDLSVAEGFDGAQVKPGQIWIAPGGFHMIVERTGTSVRLRIHQDPPENFCRPAVDVLFRSVAQIYGAGAIAVVLTGMGQDGLRGCESIREAGGQILVQDEATSIVWGMPGFVAKAGLADKVLPLEQIAGEILRLAVRS